MKRDLTSTGNLLRNADVGHMLELRETIARQDAIIAELVNRWRTAHLYGVACTTSFSEPFVRHSRKIPHP